jgi:ubiquinone/menaquinone biosynthesis C-methylase UbiE
MGDLEGGSSMTHDTEDVKQKVAKTFDTVCKDYDCAPLRFFSSSAEELLRVLNLRGNERLIDIAAGTGNISLPAAKILSQGHVTAVDLSSGMLDQARTKAEAAGLNNIKFHCCDLESLKQPDSSYDVATCGFGIFFLPDMHNGLKTIHSQLAPGGWLAITTFLENMMEPLSGMFLEKVEEFGIEPPPLSWKRLDSPDKVDQLLMESNYFGIGHNSQQMGYYLDNAADWWQVIWNSGYRGLLMQLPEEDLLRFRNEHLGDVQALADDKGIWMDVPVLFTLARV